MNITSKPRIPTNCWREMVRPDTTSCNENSGAGVPNASMVEVIAGIEQTPSKSSMKNARQPAEGRYLKATLFPGIGGFTLLDAKLFFAGRRIHVEQTGWQIHLQPASRQIHLYQVLPGKRNPMLRSIGAHNQQQIGRVLLADHVAHRANNRISSLISIHKRAADPVIDLGHLRIQGHK